MVHDDYSRFNKKTSEVNCSRRSIGSNYTVRSTVDQLVSAVSPPGLSNAISHIQDTRNRLAIQPRRSSRHFGSIDAHLASVQSHLSDIQYRLLGIQSPSILFLSSV